jgi:hypothetical protein
MARIPDSIHALPAAPVLQRPTSASNAWLGTNRTVRLPAPVEALRVHVGAGAAASIHKHLATGAGLHGRWFAIGDVVQTYEQYRASRALPAHFTEVAVATLAAGTVVNVGRCSPLFGHRGGGDQLEWVEGPAPALWVLDATWGRTAGNA